MIILSRSEEKLKIVEDMIHTISPDVSVRVIPTDLRDKNSYGRVREVIQDQDVSVVVNNAGQALFRPFFLSDPAELHSEMCLNLRPITLITGYARKNFL